MCGSAVPSASEPRGAETMQCSPEVEEMAWEARVVVRAVPEAGVAAASAEAVRVEEVPVAQAAEAHAEVAECEWAAEDAEDAGAAT